MKTENTLSEGKGKRMKEQIEEIERITSSNEFWGLGSGDHLNMIDTLLEVIAEKDATIDRLEKQIDAVNQAIADAPNGTAGEWQAWLYSTLPFLVEAAGEGDKQ